LPITCRKKGGRTVRKGGKKKEAKWGGEKTRPIELRERNGLDRLSKKRKRFAKATKEVG